MQHTLTKAKKRKNNFKPLIWENKNIEPDGIEIWNWFSNWGDNFNDKNIIKLAYSYFFKNKIVTNPKKESLLWWDNLNKKNTNIVPAIGGVDAHALKIYRYILPITVFPYETCFKTITNVITLKSELSDDFQTGKNQILNAIKNGNNSIINRKVYNSVPYVSIYNEQEKALIGDSIYLTSDTYLKVHTDTHVKIKLFLDGNEEYKTQNTTCELKLTKAGKYRLEFSYKDKSFAYTNPICVLKEER